MDGSTSIKAAIQNIVGAGVKVGVVLGSVVSTSPLKIKLTNDDKITAGPDNVYVPQHLTNYEAIVNVSAPKASGDTEYGGSLKNLEFEKGKLTILNALKVGDKVHLLVFNEGKQFYVLDRVM